jgi:taurine dioxygenase
MKKAGPMSKPEITKLAGHVGAEVSGVELSALTEGEMDGVRQALFDHGVIVFRDQTFSPEDHINFAERFGGIDVNRFFTPVPEHPRIAEVRTKPEQTVVIGGTWHSDHTYDPAPAMASVLVAREVPPFGGDTMFASMTAACAHLSDGLRATLEGLNAWHSDAAFQNSILDDRLSDDGVTQPVLHPSIISHPQTGQRALFVNGDFTTHFDGWTVAESKPLLEYLYAFATQPAFTCRVRWAPGAVAIWDNRLVQHYAIADYSGQSRLMHRITVTGQPLG